MEKENIIWKSKTTRLILIYLNKKEIDYANNVSRKIMACWSDVVSKFKELREVGLIEFVESKGRRKYPFVYKNKKNKYHRLTEKGKRVTESLLKIREEMK